MEMSPPTQMLVDFPRWLAATGIGISDQTRDTRWNGAKAVGMAPGRGLTEGLIRLAFKTKQEAAPAEIAKIRQLFYDVDNTFDMKGNDKELQILAGAALAIRLTIDGDSAAETALMINTTLMSGVRKSDLPMNLPVLADAAIARLSDYNRKRPSLISFTSAELVKLDFDKAVTKAKEGDPASAFTLAADAAKSVINTIIKKQASAMKALDQVARVQDEELQMLWWLIGERSVDADKRFEAIDAETRPFLLAKELADMTSNLPGPRSIRALLSRAGVKGKDKVSVTDIVNAAEDAWLKSFMPDIEPSPVTCPLHFALRRRLETGAGQAWVAGWQASAGIAKAIPLHPLVLSLLFYQERLLLRFGN